MLKVQQCCRDCNAEDCLGVMCGVADKERERREQQKLYSSKSESLFVCEGYFLVYGFPVFPGVVYSVPFYLAKSHTYPSS